MSDKEKRRHRAKQSVEQRQNKEKRDIEIGEKRSECEECVPDPEDINGPPWSKSVLLYLQLLDKRMERIEEEIGIEE